MQCIKPSVMLSIVTIVTLRRKRSHRTRYTVLVYSRRFMSEIDLNKHWLPVFYYRWELPQVSFLSCQNFVVFVATNVCLTHQNMSFVMTRICLSWQLFVTTKVLSPQNIFVVTNTTSILLSQQKTCCNIHVFVTTKLLSPWKWYLWQLPPLIVIGYMGNWSELALNAHHFLNEQCCSSLVQQSWLPCW